MDMLKRALLALLALLLPAAALAQSTAPGNAAFAALQKLSVAPIMDMTERCATEGYSFGPGISSANIAVPTGASNTTIAASTTIPPGYMVYLMSTEGSLWPRADGATQPTNPIRWQILQSNDASGRFTAPIRAGSLGPTGGLIPPMPYGQIVRLFSGGPATLTLAVRDNGSTGSVSFGGGVNFYGCLLTDDTNFSAPRILLAIGDSTCAGSSGQASRLLWEYQSRDYIRNTLGKDIRLVLKCRSGSNSTEHATWDQAGWYDMRGTIAGYLWRLGINDAAQAANPTAGGVTVTTNMATFYAKHRKLNPNADIWFFGPTYLNNSTAEANAAGIRTAMAAQVATWRATDPRVHYCNLGNALTNADLSDGTHYPTDAAENKVWAVVKACFETPGNQIRIQ